MIPHPALHISPPLRRRINSKILRWYRENGRSFPWRRTSDPYRILVSEVMLQQTQASRVEQKFPLFIRTFPTIRALARARRSDVIRAWQGMGYNRRAVHLKRIAEEVVTNLGGKLPPDGEVLRKLPGIGKYTAHALLATAFGQQVPVVDTNICRVITRLFRRHGGTQIEWDLAHALLPRSSAHEWNQALMDLGAVVCTARAPRCERCPVKSECQSAFQPLIGMKKSSRREPARHGIPNRLHRGKVIEILRSLNGKGGIPERLLLKSIVPKAGAGDVRWFRGLIEELKHDGLVTIEFDNRKRLISLMK